MAASLSVAVAITLMVFHDINSVMTRDVVASLEREAVLLQRIIADHGAAAVSKLVGGPSAADERRVLLVLDASGRPLAGSIEAVPSEIAKLGPGGLFRYAPGQGAAAGKGRDARRAVGLVRRLDDGGLLLVGSDVEDQLAAVTRIRLMLAAGLFFLTLAGLGAGFLASRRVMRRVDHVNRTARAIMAGDMRERIAVGDAGDEIDDLSRNLNQMLDRIGQLMAGLREISDNIAHDLKTPLNRLRNRAEAALRDAAGSDELREALGRAIEEADDLIKVFNAMLLIARLEAGALEGTTENLDCSALVRDVAELYEPVAEAAGLALEVVVDDRLVVEANRQLVGQAVANLIDNAIKYSSDPRKPVELAQGVVRGVAVEVARSPGDGVVISVRDRGPGIPAQDRDRVLRRFVRLEQSRSLPGTGLGLSLVAAVARLHGGSLALGDNAPGLVVTLTLPARPVSAADGG